MAKNRNAEEVERVAKNLRVCKGLLLLCLQCFCFLHLDYLYTVVRFPRPRDETRTNQNPRSPGKWRVCCRHAEHTGHHRQGKTVRLRGVSPGRILTVVMGEKLFVDLSFVLCPHSPPILPHARSLSFFRPG